MVTVPLHHLGHKRSSRSVQAAKPEQGKPFQLPQCARAQALPSEPSVILGLSKSAHGETEMWAKLKEKHKYLFATQIAFSICQSAETRAIWQEFGTGRGVQVRQDTRSESRTLGPLARLLTQTTQRRISTERRRRRNYHRSRQRPGSARGTLPVCRHSCGNTHLVSLHGEVLHIRNKINTTTTDT